MNTCNSQPLQKVNIQERFVRSYGYEFVLKYFFLFFKSSLGASQTR